MSWKAANRPSLTWHYMAGRLFSLSFSPLCFRELANGSWQRNKQIWHQQWNMSEVHRSTGEGWLRGASVMDYRSLGLEELHHWQTPQSKIKIHGVPTPDQLPISWGLCSGGWVLGQDTVCKGWRKGQITSSFPWRGLSSPLIIVIDLSFQCFAVWFPWLHHQSIL